jgi:DNA-binding protein YbaB
MDPQRSSGSPQGPNWNALESMIVDLRKSISNMGDVQRRMMRMTGVAWSDDRLVKAVVGPRGQLLELEIDPRVYRTPNSKALAASIVATVRAAVEDVLREGNEILQQSLPAEAGIGVDAAVMRMARQHDSEVLKEANAEDE